MTGEGLRRITVRKVAPKILLFASFLGIALFASSCSLKRPTGGGTALANVANVQVTCGNIFPIGGTISGLLGTGMVLQDNTKDNLNISGTGGVNFTFATPLAAGSAYAVTILTQPANPGQTCTVLN